MQVRYVNVFVSDLSRAVLFYGDVLGLRCIRKEPDHGYAAFEAGAVQLGLAEVDPEQDTLLERHTGIGFVVEDVMAEHDRLAEAGVVFPMRPAPQPWGSVMALFADPDGNVFYLDEG